MQITGISDSMVKTQLVQQVQERPADIARAQEAANAPRQEELARQADEVVVQLHETENEGIREEQERKKNFKRGKKRDEDDSGEDELADADVSPPLAGGFSRRLDVQA